MLSFLRSSMRFLVAVAVAAASFTVSARFASASVSTYYLNGNDPGNDSSLTSPLTGAASGWALLTTAQTTAATAGNIYIDTGFNMRTPTSSSTPATFAGAALVLAPSAATLANGFVTSGALFSSEIIFKTSTSSGPSGVPVDTANMILNGGFLNEGSGNGTAAWAVLAGTMSVAGPLVSALGADAAEFLQVNSTISGSGALQVGGGSVGGVIVNNGQSQGTVILTGTNVNYSGIISVGSLVGTGATAGASANSNLQGSNSGGYNQNMLEAFGTGQINVYSAVNSTSSSLVNGYTGITTLSLLSNGTANGGQTILVGSGATALNNLNVSGSATVNLNNFNSNSSNTFQFGNLSIGGSAGTTSALKLSTSSGYGLSIAGTTSVTGPAGIVNFNTVPSGMVNLGSITNIYSNAASLTLWQSSSSSTTLANPITDNGVNALSVAFTGGSWTITNTSNSYIGSTTIGSGTLNLGVANAVPAASAIGFAGNAVLNMGPYSPTFGGLSTTVGASTLGVATVIGTGTLNISNPSGTFQMTPNTSGSTALNLTQVGAFSANVNQFVVGNNPLTSPSGIALLALSPSNTITTPSLLVSYGTANAGSMTAYIVLGAVNNLNVGNLTVAYDKNSTTGLASEITWTTIAPLPAVQPGTLTLAGLSGAGSRAEVTVGQSNFGGGTGSSAIGMIDLTGGTVNAAIDTLTLGLASANQVDAGTQANGTFIFTAGSVNVNTMIVGQSAVTNTNVTSGSAAGTFTIGGGTLQVNSAMTLASSQGAITPTGTFNLNGGVALIDCPIQGGGGTSTFNFNGGTLMAGTSSTTFMQGLTGANVGNSGAFINPNGNNITIAQPLQSSGGSIGGLTESGPGVLTLAGSSTYVGPTTINGVLNAAFLSNVNTPSPIGLGSAAGSPADLVINGGTLQYTGATPTSTNRLFTVGASGAATLDASGNANGALTIGSGGGAIAFANTSTPATLTLTGSGAGAAAGTLGAVIGDSNPGNFATSLVKMGAGSWNLTAANTFTGQTNVNAGGLYVNGSLPSSGTVNVAAGAVLGGTGSAGNAIVSSGGGIDVSGNAAATLTLASLNFSGNGTVYMPAFTGTNNLALQAGSLTAGGGAGSVQIDFPNAPLANGTYRLIGYSAIGGAGFSAFSVAQSGSLGARQSTALLNNAGEIDYQVTGQTPYWNATQTDWLGTNAWTLQPSGLPTTFITGDNDVFDDSAGTGAIAVTISAANVAPISVTFNNNQASYNLSGAFGIVDGNTPTFLVKSGSGALTIANSNGYSGGTTLTAGLLNINNASAIGSGLLTINGGTLDNTSGAAIAMTANNPQVWNADIVFNGTSSLNMGSGTVALGASRVVTVLGGDLSVGGISGAGFSLTKAGTGTLTLTGANTYNSGTIVLAGLLQVAGGSNSLNTAGAITTSGGTLDLGGLGQSTSGLISFQGGGAQNGTLTETGVSAFDAESGNVNAVLDGNVGLNKTTSGTVVLGGANTYTGITSVSAGVLQLSAPNGSLPPASPITITGGTLDLGTQTQSTSGAVTVQGGVLQNGTLSTTGAFTIQGGIVQLGTLSTSGVVTFQGGLVQSGTFTETNTADAFAAQNGTVNDVLAGSVGLNKTTTGTVVLGGNNLYTGNTTVSAGLLQLAGTNSYAGTTNLSGGTLQTLVSNALPATTTLVFTGSPTVDLAGTTSQTIAGLTATAADTSVIQNIGAGQTLSIVSTATAAVVSLSATNATTNVSVTVSGAGGLAITATNGSFQMNMSETVGNVTSLSMSGLGSFSANVNEFDAGINPGGAGNGGSSLLVLAQSNTITAQNLYVGKGPYDQGNTWGNMYLGAANTFNVANFYVGTGKEGIAGTNPNGSVVSFNGQSGTFNLYGATGPGSLAEVTLGWYNVNDTGNSPEGTIDLTGGTANANIDTLTLGLGDAPNLSSAGETPTGTFIFNAGTVNVNNLILGETTLANTANSGQPRGVFTIGGGTLTVNDSFMLGDQIGRTTPVGTFNLNGGVVLVGSNIQTIQTGGGTGFFYFNGGMLVAGTSSTNYLQVTGAYVEGGGAFINTNGNNVTISQNLLDSGDGALTKLGAGMLVLAGVNTYAGGTTVSAGTLQMNNNSALGAPTGPLTVNSSVLDLDGNSPTVGALSGNSFALITNSAANSGGTLTVGPSGGATSTYNGTIADGPSGGTVSLALTGTGTLYLTGSNTYSGGTTVEDDASLIVTAPYAIDALGLGTNLSVGSDLSAFGTIQPAGQTAAAPAGGVAPVPEPCTLALLAAGAAGAGVAARRRRRRR
jgi:fibronectin-binding autotransporter adhesin